MVRLCLCLLLVACDPVEAEGDVVYGHAAGRALTLDVRVPDGEGPFPAVVFIHGGGWVSGDLRMYDEAVDLAVARGMVGITINYRLADAGGDQARHPWPAQLQDVRCALRWLGTNADRLHVDLTRVATMGESAGGHLAFMAAYASDQARFDPLDCAGPDVAVAAAVSLAGVDDLMTVYATTRWYIKAYITRWLALPDGASVVDHQARFDDADVLTYLDDGPRVPALILQGLDDITVPPLSQRTFVAAAEHAGQDVTLVELDGVDHAEIRDRAVLERALDWLVERL